jgi:hypothetical protein
MIPFIDTGPVDFKKRTRTLVAETGFDLFRKVLGRFVSNDGRARILAHIIGAVPTALTQFEHGRGTPVNEDPKAVPLPLILYLLLCAV